MAVIVLAIACVAIVPHYFTGQWPWSQPIQLSSAKWLQDVRQTGIELTDWPTLEQQTVEIGHKKWSVQALEVKQDAHSEINAEQWQYLEDKPVFLFLRPQSDAQDKPLVEWIDIDGFQGWTADEHQAMRFQTTSASENKAESVSARYFRGWSRIQGEQGNQTYTYAVSQWYSWPTGGSPDISAWFWADQWQQWHTRERMPWVAVSLLVPIKPLADIDPIQPLVEAIASTVQTSLLPPISSP